MAKKAKNKGGRPKGSVNKRTLQVSEILSLKSVDLIGELTKILFPSEEETQEKMDFIREICECGGKPPADLFMGDKDRANLILKFMEYVYPKRRSIDIKAEVDINKVKENRDSLQTIAENPEVFDAIEAICEVIE